MLLEGKKPLYGHQLNSWFLKERLNVLPLSFTHSMKMNLYEDANISEAHTSSIICLWDTKSTLSPFVYINREVYD